jgi:hypothetical protein
MGICTSTKKNKEIKANQRNSLKKEIDKKENLNESKESKESNDESKKKSEENEENEQNDLIKNDEDEKKKNDSLLSKDSENEDEDENNNKKKNRSDDKGKQIIINYRMNGKTEFQEVFKTIDNISNLFDILLVKKSKYAEYDLTTNEYLSLSSKLNEKIGNIFKDVEDAEVNMLYLGLDISDDIKLENENTNTVIGMPLFDLGQDIGLLIYHKIEKKFTTEIIKDNKLSKFNHLSSICNGKNILYLSGGDNTGKHGKAKASNYFSSVDLLSPKSIHILPVLNIARSWHSMIYIPKKYIYIIGGGTNETELYDIEKKSIIIDNKMNEIRNECTLFVMNNSILYAFCGLSIDGNFISTVERSNLRQKERTWSYVNYSTADNTLFDECFYIGTLLSDTSLILFAANEDEKNEFSNILFDLEDEDNPTLSLYESEAKIIDVVPEKVFHPIGQNISVMIPLVGTKAKIYKLDEALKLNIEYFPEALKSIME